MKLTFQKDALLNGINIVLKAVTSKTTMSILECILIDASGTDIKLTGNDMELGIETKVEGTILGRGKIALDAKLFSEIVRKLSGVDSEITIESDDRLNTVISCENSVFTIQGRDGDEFSYIPYIERDKYIALSQFTLKEIIRQTIFSISPNLAREITPELILQIVSDHLGIQSIDILGQKRNKEIAGARQIVMYLCRNMTSTPLQQIGQFLGGRDHTTIIHGIEKIAKDLPKDPALQNTIEILTKKINPQ